MTAVLALFWLAAVQEAPSDVPSLLRAGDASYLKADYEAAHQSFQKAWELVQQTAPENPARYDILKRLTSARAAAGEFADADQFLGQAIHWRETVMGGDDPKIADDLLLEVSLCRSMKDHDRARLVLTRVMGLHAQASGYDSKPVADDYSRMAQIAMDQTKLEEAVSALNLALSLRTRLVGTLDPSLVPDLDRLGQVYITQRNYENAEWAYQRALVIRESIYGKMNADLIATVDGLAYALFGQKKYDRAEPLYQRLIALWVGSVGGEHPMVAMALDKVAIFYAEQKKWDQANEASDRAHAIRAAILAQSLVQDATRRYDESDMAACHELLGRALKALDPPNPMYDKLHDQVISLLKVVAAETAKTGKKK
jgi:tetratricopeptide (TPR) repeat protein